jgi:hypothetical protein
VNVPGEPPVDYLHWQVEMHQTARELKAEIDSKLVALQAATRLAREEQRRLEQSIERARQTNGGPANAALRPTEPPSEAPPEVQPDTLEMIQRLGDRTGSLAGLSVANLPAVQPLATLPTNASQAATIDALARAGHSAARIARELSLPLGDVELSLSLGSRAGS